jgi:hypothetical protein
MAEIERAVPILPVPLVAAALLQAPAPTSPEALRTRVAALLEGLTARGSVLRLSPLRLEATISPNAPKMLLSCNFTPPPSRSGFLAWPSQFVFVSRASDLAFPMDGTHSMILFGGHTMLRNNLSVAAVSVLMAGCFTTTSTVSSANRTVTIVNQSGSTISRIYGSNAGTNSWEEIFSAPRPCRAARRPTSISMMARAITHSISRLFSPMVRSESKMVSICAPLRPTRSAKPSLQRGRN